MAPDAVTQERIYRALRQELLSEHYRPGVRIDLHAVADRHRASTTPVREALYRLMGERLVEPHGDGGFQLALPNAAELMHLYTWNAQHLLSALHLAREVELRPLITRKSFQLRGAPPADLADAIGDLFASIATATANIEFIRHVEAANDRLHHPRMAEARYFGDVDREIQTFAKMDDLNARTRMRRRIMAYHRRRVEHVSQIEYTIRVDAQRL